MQQNRALIRLDHIAENARSLKMRANGAKLCAVVKADGYGHGAAEAARALSGCADMYAVALVEEGMRLRLTCREDILVLVPPLTEGEALRGMLGGLIFTVGDAADLALVARTAEKYSLSARCHLKVNTGMNRFGFDAPAFSEISAGKLPRRVRIEGIYSHFYMPENAAAARLQYDKFLSLCGLAEKRFGRITRHLAATGGLLADPSYCLDMVRPGIGLYGYLPAGFAGTLPLKRAMSVRSSVVCSRPYVSWGAGYGGYSGSGHLTAVRCGYADGFFRSGGLGNVNSLCMDACLYSQKKEKYAEVCVLDDADAYAEKCGTISYEVLVRAAERAVKIYVGG